MSLASRPSNMYNVAAEGTGDKLKEKAVFSVAHSPFLQDLDHSSANFIMSFITLLPLHYLLKSCEALKTRDVLVRALTLSFYSFNS